MKKSKFTESQIIKALKENESGRSVEEISRDLGITKGTFYTWRRKYGGMEVSHLKRLKELEEENQKLKQMYADQALQLKMAKDVISNLPAFTAGRQESGKAFCQKRCSRLLEKEIQYRSWEVL